MICGALQTLNEEALEDVLQSEPPSRPGEPPLHTATRLAPAATSLPHTNSDSRLPLREHVVQFEEDAYL